jgi:hypothetical protein
MSRERFWGLYNWKFEEWCLDHSNKRLRFTSAEAAGNHAHSRLWGRHVGPRPFYVVRKATKKDAVIRAARDYRDYQGRLGERDQEDYELWQSLNVALKRLDDEC